MTMSFTMEKPGKNDHSALHLSSAVLSFISSFNNIGFGFVTNSALMNFVCLTNQRMLPTQFVDTKKGKRQVNISPTFICQITKTQL